MDTKATAIGINYSIGIMSSVAVSLEDALVYGCGITPLEAY